MIEKNHLKKIGIKKFIAVFLVFCMMVCYFPPFVAKASSTDVQVVGIHKDSTKENIRIVLDTLPASDTTYSGFTVDIIGGQVNVEELPVDVTSDADNCITLSIGTYLTEETNYQVTLKGSATDTITGETIRLADDLQIHVDSSGVVYEEIPTNLWPGIKHDANSKGELYMQSEDLSSRVEPYEPSTDETQEVVQLPGFEYVTTSNFYDASGEQMEDSVTADADTEGINGDIIVPYTTLKDSEGTELESHDKTLLSLKVDFEENTSFTTNTNLMIAASTNYMGFLVRPESSDELRIQTYGGVQSSPTVYYLSTDKVASMTDNLILQLGFEYGDFDNDNNGIADDVKLGVYINGATAAAVLDGNVDDGAITSDNHLMFYNCDMTKLGTQMVLNTLNRTQYNAGDITVSKVTAEKPKLVALNGFEHVTTSNFYDASDVQMVDSVTADADGVNSEIIVSYTTLKNSEGTELSSHDKTLLSLNVDFEANTTFMTNTNLMVAASQNYVGLLVRPENNNQLRIQTYGGVQSSPTVYYLSTDKVASMTDGLILQLSFAYGDFDNDNNGAADDVKLGVYINGASCTAEIDGNVDDGEITSDNHLMFYNCDMTKLGTQMVLNTLNRTEYNTGDVTVSKVIVEKPEPVTLNGFEHVTTSNFHDASGVQMADSVTADADIGGDIVVPYTTLKDSEGTVLSSHDKTLLSLNVDFEENTEFITNTNLMVVASQNWVGLLIRPQDNNLLRIQTYGGVQSSPTVYYLSTDKVTSITDELILQLSFEYGDFDNNNNGTADDVKLGVYINGAMCTAELDGNVDDGEITSDNHLMFYNCDMTKLGTQMVLNTLSRAEYNTGDITVSKVSAKDNGSRYTLQPIGMDDGVFIQQADGTEESYSFESFTLKDSQFVCLKYSDTTFEDGTIFHIKGTFKLLHTSGACYKNTYNKAIRLDVKYQYEDDAWRRYDDIGSSTLVPGYQYNAEIQDGYLYMVGTDYTGMLQDFASSERWRLYLKPLNEESGVFCKPSGGEEERMNPTDYTFMWPANINRQFCLGVGNNRTEGDIFTIRGEFEVVTGSGGTYYKDGNYVKVLTIEESSYRYDGITWTCLSSPKATVKIAGGNIGNHSNNTEIYLDSSIEFQLQGWEGAKAIRALSNDENSGVFLNDVKQTNSYLLETGSEGLFLSIGGATVQNGDKITLKGAFQQDAASADGNKEIVTYEESNFWYGTEIPQKDSDVLLSTWYDDPIGNSEITGDINADGEVNVVDLIRLKRWYAGQRVPIKNSHLSATVNHTSEEGEMIPAFHNRILRSDAMPIIGYYGPLAHGWNEAAGVEELFPNFLTDYYFELIADAGINTIMYSGNDYGTEGEKQFVMKSLDLADKYGIGYYLMDSSVTKYAEDGLTIDTDVLANQMAEYSSHPAFKGLHVVDEPNSENYLPDHFDDKTTTDVVENKYISKHLDLIAALDEIKVNNLQGILPCYDYSESNAVLYEQYVEEYCEGFKPKLLTYDHYLFDPLQNGKEVREDIYFWNMSVIREYAEKYDIPFGVTIQAGGQWNDAQDYFESTKPYYPTKGQFDWNVNTSLAFGTKSITYFPLIQPYHFSWAGTAKEDKSFDFDRNGMIGANGQLNDWYYYAQDINKHIKAIDDVLMYSENQGLLLNVTDAGTKAEKPDSFLNTDTYTVSNFLADFDDVDYIIDQGVDKQWSVKNNYLYVSESYEEDLETPTWREVVDVDGNALVGCFDFEGKTVLYVVNYDMEEVQDITLNFSTPQSIERIQKAETFYHESTNQLVLNMKPGEGALVLLH